MKMGIGVETAGSGTKRKERGRGMNPLNSTHVLERKRKTTT
jgi:hypothetical protein